MSKTAYNISLKGYVGGYDFDRSTVDRELAKNDGKQVNVLIDSLGGSLATGLSISAAFKNHGQVNVHFVGLNASAATIASLGAAHISIDAGAMYLVHQCSMASFEWGSLNSAQFTTLIADCEKIKADLDKLDLNCARLYAARCKRKPEDLLALMKVGGWLTAKEALDWGFVEEITLDLSDSMRKIVRTAFPKADRVIDRFHIQKLACDAVQELRIKHRWDAIQQANDEMEEAKLKGENYIPFRYHNGDTRKELLIRSRYLLFKSANDWTDRQKQRAAILFEEYPDIKKAYGLCHSLRMIFSKNTIKDAARLSMAKWYNKVEEAGFHSFNVIAATFHEHYNEILNFYNNRSSNAMAESFNAKIKLFRANLRGVADKKFFLFRIANLYAYPH